MSGRPKKAKAARKSSRKPVRRASKPARSATASKANPLDDLIASGARALGLKIDAAWMPAVRSNLEVTLRHGASVMDFALSDEAEPAPVFRA